MSIIDYQQQHLCKDIWIDNEIKFEVRKFIIQSLESFFRMLDFKEISKFIKGVYIGSSLATYFYKEDTDLDIKVVMDTTLFKKHNPSFENIKDELLLEAITKKSREEYYTTQTVPGTNHPLDFYFYSTNEFDPIQYIKYDSLYDLLNNKWLKEPKKLMSGLSPKFILDEAKRRAKPFLDKITLDIHEAKRSVIDFMFFYDYIKTLDEDDLVLIQEAFNELLQELNDDIETLVEDKQLIKELRRDSFTKKELESDLEKWMGSLNFSDVNLTFKLLQRYGYMKILVEIKDLYTQKDNYIYPDAVNEVYEILNG